jgi:hypothetical protein
MPHDRETLAAIAANLIVESHLTDWSLARRKAAERLGLSARTTPMPSDEEIVAEIKTYHALYGGEDYAAQLSSQRETAWELMRALARFDPRLVGPVAEGWAHAGSDIVIDITADSSKDVEIELVNLGADIDAREGRDGASHLHIADADWPIRVSVRPRGRAPDPRHKVRLTALEVKQIVQSAPS